MRCPKCGYNSFDHLDSCKKCGKDLVEFKQKYGIVSVLFPGQMQPVEKPAVAEDESVVDDAVAAATAATVGGAVAAGAATAADEELEAAESGVAGASDSDDFGFDFMGDSEEEEDLSFDELFEEAPADEDVEETLPSPEEEVSASAEDEFAFDINEEETADRDSELEDDFGFDPATDAESAEEGSKTDEFELPPPEEDDFSFDSEESDAEESAEKAGAEEDPKNPFDLPESPQDEVAPEEPHNLFSSAASEAGAGEEDDLLLSEPWEAREAPAPGEEALADELFVTEPEAAAAEAGLPEDFESAVSSEFPDALPEVGPLEPTTDFAAPAEPEEVDDLSAAAPLAAAALGTAAVLTATDDPVAAEEKSDLLPATGNRVLAFCCDLLVLVAVGISFVVAAEAAISTSDGLLPSLETLIDLSIPYFLVLFSLAFGYFTLFHFLAGQTPGKMLAGLRVETVAGEPLVFSQASLITSMISKS